MSCPTSSWLWLIVLVIAVGAFLYWLSTLDVGNDPEEICDGCSQPNIWCQCRSQKFFLKKRPALLVSFLGWLLILTALLAPNLLWLILGR